MRRSLTAITAIVLGCAAALVFARSDPASAAPITPAVHYGEENATMVQEIGRRWKRRWGRPYAYGYRYRPYAYGYRYRPYAYYGYPYWRRPYYGYYGYGYPYWRRPGISFGFAF